jgi:4'-phosphopantetheinyl transferase
VEVETADDGTVRGVLRSERASRTGRKLQADHFRATLLLGEQPALDGLPAAFFFSEDPLAAGDIYSRFFHGPVFQVLQEAGAIAQQGLIADVQVDHAALGGVAGLLSAPLVLEAAFQGAGLHRMAVEGTMALPESIEEVQLLQVPEDGQPLGLMVQRREDSPGVYDVDVDGPSGAVLRLRGFRMIDTGPLDDGDRLEPPEGGWPVVVVARAVQRSGPADRARSELHPVELAEIAARGLPRRQRDRLAGRLAARRAVQALLGHGDWILRTAPSGAPVVDLPAPQEPRITVTHRDGQALAAACLQGQLGLDRERPQLRSPSFLATWLSPGERTWAGDDPWRQTAVWCVKEAVLKALGTGMAIDPRQVELVASRGRRVTVALRAEAAVRHRALGGGEWCVVLGEADGDVVAAATLVDRRVDARPAGREPLCCPRQQIA